MAVGDLKRLVQGTEIDSATIVDSTAGTAETAIEEIQSGKSIFKILGSIKKALQGCLTVSKLANNLLTTDETMALAAPMGKQLGDDVASIKDTLTNFQTDISNTFVLATGAAVVNGRFTQILEPKKCYFVGHFIMTTLIPSGTVVTIGTTPTKPRHNVSFPISSDNGGNLNFLTVGSIDTNGVVRVTSVDSTTARFSVQTEYPI